MIKRNIILLLLFIVISLGVLLLPKEKEEEEEIQSSVSEMNFNQNNELIPVAQLDVQAVLVIPKIGLQRGYYAKEDKRNNVNQNIMQISNNCLPDSNCTIVLASHSGNSAIAFFTHLDLLEVSDEADIIVNNTTYRYQLSKILKQKKDGTIEVPPNIPLVLTTCDKLNQNSQDVYLFNLMK